ncbi:hypothetical protein ABBQ38_009910 [Trebouxia sp. C0009 RCD-2024]
MRRAACQRRLLLLLNQEAQASRCSCTGALSASCNASTQASPAGCLPSTSAPNISTACISGFTRPLRQFSAVAQVMLAEESGDAVRSHFSQNGIQCSFETGKLAPLSDGSCLVKCGQTWVLASVSCSEGFRMRDRTSPNVTVEYREPLSGVGRMPGGRSKSEGGPNDREAETAMLIEKAIMPLFPAGFNHNLTVTVSMLCTDGTAPASSLAVNAVSAALMCSNIPWNGPVAAVQIACSESGEGSIMQASVAELAAASMSGIYVGTADSALLADFQGTASSPQLLSSALQAAQAALPQILQAQQQLAAQHSSTTATAVAESEGYAGCDPAAAANIIAVATPKVQRILSDSNADMSRVQRDAALKEAKEAVVQELTARGIFRFSALRNLGSGCATQPDVDWVWQEVQSRVIRDMAFKDNLRVDGRGFIDVRPASFQAGVLPVVHGSALGQQGLSQVLVTSTIGDDGSAAKSEGITGELRQQLMVQLNARVAAATEASTTGRDRVTQVEKNRNSRNIGRLLERGLQATLPATHFPFAVRLNVDLLSGDGSEAMAALSAASLALGDAGVAVQAHVAGMEVAVFTDSPHSAMDGKAGSSQFEVVLDPNELESNFSDVLVQVVATQQGITALHVDSVQRGGVPVGVLTSALAAGWEGVQAQHGRMKACIDQIAGRPGQKLGSVRVPNDRVGRLIGPKGSVINKIRDDTGAVITIDESHPDHAQVLFFCPQRHSAEATEQAIRGATGIDLYEGSVHTVKVIRMMDFGAIVEFPSGSSSLLHISQISHTRVNTIHDALSLGQELQVKVTGHDQRGNLQISHKALTEPEAVESYDYQGSGASQKPYQATNARFQQSGGKRNQRDQGVQKARMPYVAVVDASQ